MILDIDIMLDYAIARPVDLILQIKAPDLADQRVLREMLDIGPQQHIAHVASETGLGERVLIRATQDLRCAYTARIEIDRLDPALEYLDAVPPHMLPGDIVRYLLPSRYCPSGEFESFVDAEFGDLQGGEKISAIRDWIFRHYHYVPGSSNAQTTAIDTFVQRQGVCRDFAHVLIALARASAIPARFASVYAPDVTPQDFHAVAEIYLDGTWHLVDPTGMARADQIVRIGVGLDAAEVSFLTSFGPVSFKEQRVRVTVAQ